MNEEFSHRLKSLRERLKLTQAAMGERLGVSGRYIGMIEGGEKQVEPSSSLAKLFDLMEANSVQSEKLPIESVITGSGQKLPIQSVITGHLEEPAAAYQLGGGRAKLKAARLAAGLNQAQLAKAVGYSVGTYQEIEDGRSQMGEKMAAKVARVLGVDVDDLTNGSDHPPERGATNGSFGTAPELRMGPGMEGVRAKMVPLLSLAQCGAMMAYDDSAYDHSGFVCYDPQDAKAFAVRLAGDSMQPKFDAGDVAVIYPSKPPRHGGVVIAKLRDEHGGDVMLKLYSAARDQVTLSSYNPAYPPMSWPRDAFAWIYPVAQVTKML
jgi:transcriptional regulator with XRE-family HTH domain